AVPLALSDMHLGEAGPVRGIGYAQVSHARVRARDGRLFSGTSARKCDMKPVRGKHDHEKKERCVAVDDVEFRSVRRRTGKTTGPEKVPGSRDASERRSAAHGSQSGTARAGGGAGSAERQNF